MADRYPIPASFHRVEETIKRSRFITSLGHAPDLESARAFVAAVKEEFPDATHNCWAFNAGPPGDTAFVGLSDDGEPSGTAGKPMLTALLHSGVGEIAAVVTRYFGGTKLGTGGLVRAYTSMVNLGLETLPTRDMVITVRRALSIPYPAVTLFKRMLPEFEAEVAEETFAEDAGFLVELPEERASAFADAVTQLTDGRAVIREK
ncbi:YigZ family protein [Pseudodesulfovibrio indicus]|uniref:IMPACT family protein n=1 Tax=Pseudodesulfovibrio indicus TaxID=1716143 RepID=A0A126QJL9_9BACT|nr:YigZ family protein [Pseudodesulfovibrio indicus]AMK10193.1 IMPACT family protein [Pseudodesulfovibrio indicus]TDT87901.1 putative YigZ family protein [Pseudodesulfovibrio indicus]